MREQRFSLSTVTIGVFAMLVLSVPHVALSQSAGDYVIGPQDVLSIAVFDQADLGGKYTVELDGSFTFPLVGRVRAGGLTIRNFEAELKKAAGRRVLQEPAGHGFHRAVPQPTCVRHR